MLSTNLRPFLLTLWALCSWVRPLHADTTREAVLASVLMAAHNDGNLAMLKRLAGGRQDLPWALWEARFRRHQAALLPASLVTCSGIAEMAQLPTDPGARSGAVGYRCEVLCAKGTYTLLLALSSRGHLEQLWLASPLPEGSPLRALAGRLPPSTWLVLGYAVALLLLRRGFHHLRRSAEAVYTFRTAAGLTSAIAARAPSRALQALHRLQVVLLALAGLAVLGLVLPHWWRVAPVLTWGNGLCLLGGGAVALLGFALLLSAYAELRRPALGVAAGALLPACLFGGAVVLSGSHEAPDPALQRQQQRYRVPLSAQRGPSYVAQNSGASMVFVYQEPDGRACRRAPLSECRGFGAPVLAPADGTIEYVWDRQVDHPPGLRVLEQPDGNLVVLRSAGERIVLAHLQQGSILVQPGAQVRSGEPVARLGSSGDCAHPQLRMAVLPLSASLPVPRSAASGPLQLNGYWQQTLRGPLWTSEGVPWPGQRIWPAQGDFSPPSAAGGPPSGGAPPASGRGAR